MEPAKTPGCSTPSYSPLPVSPAKRNLEQDVSGKRSLVKEIFPNEAKYHQILLPCPLYHDRQGGVAVRLTIFNSMMVLKSQHWFHQNQENPSHTHHLQEGVLQPLGKQQINIPVTPLILRSSWMMPQENYRT